MSPKHWRNGSYFLLVLVLFCRSSAVAQSEKQRVARVNLGGADVERLITSLTELKVMDTKHQKLDASSFRDVKISGSEVPFNFTARYRNYQEVPVPKFKRVESKVLGQRVVVDVPDGVRMELKELLDVSGKVNAKLVLRNVGDNVELAVEIVDIPIKGMPKELREPIVGEVKKQVDRTLFSQSTYLPAYDAEIAITLAQPIGSSTYFEAAPRRSCMLLSKRWRATRGCWRNIICSWRRTPRQKRIVYSSSRIGSCKRRAKTLSCLRMRNFISLRSKSETK